MTDLLPTDLSTDDARELTNFIRSLIGDVWVLIRKAHAGRVWIALEYDSWDAYLALEFAGKLPQLTREERRAVVASMSSDGMSTRAIAAAVGTTHPTVIGDLRPGGKNLPPESALTPDEVYDPPAPRVVRGLDGKEYNRNDGQDRYQRPDKRGDLDALKGYRNAGDDRTDNETKAYLATLRALGAFERAIEGLDPIDVARGCLPGSGKTDASRIAAIAEWLVNFASATKDRDTLTPKDQ